MSTPCSYEDFAHEGNPHYRALCKRCIAWDMEWDELRSSADPMSLVGMGLLLFPADL